MGRRARSILGSCYDAGGAARGTKGTALIGGHCGTGDAHHCQRGQLLFGRVHLRRANQERPPNGERRKLQLQSDDSLIALSVREPAHLLALWTDAPGPACVLHSTLSAHCWCWCRPSLALTRHTKQPTSADSRLPVCPPFSRWRRIGSPVARQVAAPRRRM